MEQVQSVRATRVVEIFMFQDKVLYFQTQHDSHCHIVWEPQGFDLQIVKVSVEMDPVRNLCKGLDGIRNLERVSDHGNGMQ